MELSPLRWHHRWQTCSDTFTFKQWFLVLQLQGDLFCGVDGLSRRIVQVSYGKQSDAGILSHSHLGQALLPPNSLHLPDDATITGAEELGPVPYVVVGDEAFPLQRHVMHPYPGRNCTEAEESYNYRHSRARRIVECTFGILAARWRVYHMKLGVAPVTVNQIIQAATILHNMLQRDSIPASTAELIEDYNPDNIHGLDGLHLLGTRGTTEAARIREKFKEYFVAHPLPWQTQYVGGDTMINHVWVNVKFE